MDGLYTSEAEVTYSDESTEMLYVQTYDGSTFVWKADDVRSGISAVGDPTPAIPDLGSASYEGFAVSGYSY